jgi:hypothetical protein
MFNSGEFSPKRWKFLSRLADEWSIHTQSPLVKTIVETIFKGDEAFQEGEKDKVSRLLKGSDLMEKAFDFEILIHLLKKNAPKVSIVVAGARHARVVISQLEELGYSRPISVENESDSAFELIDEGFITGRAVRTQDAFVHEVSQKGIEILEDALIAVKEYLQKVAGS